MIWSQPTMGTSETQTPRHLLPPQDLLFAQHPNTGLGGRLQGICRVGRVAGDEGLELGARGLHLKSTHSHTHTHTHRVPVSSTTPKGRGEGRVAQHRQHANPAVRQLRLSVPRQQALVLGEASKKNMQCRSGTRTL